MLGTLIKGIRILELFSVGHPRWRITEISRELGLNKSAVFRVVETLESEGYLHKDLREKSYMLTAKLLGLSTVVLSQFNIVEQSKSAIDHLWAATQGTVVVRLFEGKRLVTVAVRESPHVLEYGGRVGPHKMMVEQQDAVDRSVQDARQRLWFSHGVPSQAKVRGQLFEGIL